MGTFDRVVQLAAQHRGGKDALEALLTPVPDPSRLAQMSDDRLLSIFSSHVFSTGLSWKVIENKWPGFEEAFHGFDPRRNAMMSDDDIDRLVQDTRIVRHGAKIVSVRDNAIWFVKLADEHGSAAKFFADWPASDQITLMETMKKDGSRLGGSVGTYSLRHAGKDCFMLTSDVNTALVREGVIDKPATSKKAMAAVQQAFNRWHGETGRPYTHLSRILALSVG